MQIEAGKSYESRNGQKRTMRRDDDDAALRGSIILDTECFPYWRSTGRVSINEETPYDLIREWIEITPAAPPLFARLSARKSLAAHMAT